MEVFRGDDQVKKKFFTLKVLFTVTGVFQGLSIGSLIFLLPALVEGNYELAFKWLIFMVVAGVICFFCQYIGMNMGNKMAVWEVCDNQIHEIGRALTTLPLGWFDGSSKGKVTRITSGDTNTLSHIPSVVLPEIYTTVAGAITIGIIMTLTWWPLGVIMAVMGAFLRMCWKWNLNILDQVQSDKTKFNEKMEATIVEFAQLQPVLRSAGVLTEGWETLDKAIGDDKKGTLALMGKQSKPAGVYMAICNGAMFLVLAVAGWATVKGSVDPGSFLAIATMIVRFANPLAGLLPYGTEIHSANWAIKNIESVVNAPRLPEIDNPVVLPNKIHDIELKNVDFSYVPGVPVLKNLSLTMKKGTMTAIVGPSGSGKSTVTRLIARFWDVDQGQVLIDGVNVKDLGQEWLMANMSMVFQDVYLFNTTIRENVAMAKPGATDEEINLAAEKAGLDQVVETLVDGWDTMVGEGGASLSGGEKQRVSIARAFLKDAPILLLDEITSALDGTNEAIITRAIEILSRDRTVVVIAHRLTSIRSADAIAVIEDGQIAEYGTHDQLVGQGKGYSRLWEASISSEQWRV